MKIAFYETQDWEEEYLKEKLPGHTLEFFGASIETESILDADIVSPFVKSKISSKLLSASPKLKFVATRSTGFDHIDIKACTARGVLVANVPTYGENTIAEFAFALLLTLSRKMYASVERLKEQGWWSSEGLRGFDLAGKTLGVVGTGHIGAHVIQIAKGFNMNVVAFDANKNISLQRKYKFKYVTLEELLKQADIITLHLPYLPTTHHMLNSQSMKLIKPGAILINTARGALVETKSLIEALQTGVLAGAALDVLEEEGHISEEATLLQAHPNEEQLKILLTDHILMQMENVLITPHNAFNTTEAIKRILDTTVGNIQGFIDGKPGNVVTK